MSRRELMAVAVLVCMALTARAETLVTACGTDTAAGGLNLATALASGGDIRIACAGGPNEITLSANRSLPLATTIDGGGVILIGSGSGAMFAPTGALPLKLRNLTLRNPPSGPGAAGTFTGIVYDANDVAVVELTNVQVLDTRLPFAVRRLVARNSTFVGNGDASNSDFGVVMAGDLELESTVFRDNLSRPFHALWRGDPILKNQTIVARVVNSTFERNRRPALWVAGQLTIESSRFIDNGDAAPFAPGGRGALYGGAIFLELGRSAAGAVEVLLGRATISRSTFEGNRGMLGGAVLASRSALTVQSTDFDANRAVSGGAIAYLSPEGSNPLLSRMRLGLAHVKMRGNEATKDGGALLLQGDVSGDAILMANNAAGESGAALAVVSASAAPGEAVPAAIASELPAPGPESTRIELMRTFVLDNTAAGHAIDLGAGVARFGNLLLARNIATATGSAAMSARNVELANSTLIGNQSAGLHIEAGGASGVRLANVILASNATNCSGTLAMLSVDGSNVQFPDAGCGATIPVTDPSLDSRFAPTLFSAARDAGSVPVCMSHDLVSGHDVYARARGAASCAVGAVEADIVRDVIERVGADNVPWLLLLLLVILLLCAVIGFVCGVRRRRRKRATVA